MTAHRRRHGGLVLLCVVVSALVTGCGGDDQADPRPSFSPTPTTATTSSSPVGTSSSAAPVQESPEAFVRRWNDSSTKMQNTGVTTDYEAISSGCDACSKTATLVRQYYAAGGFVRTKGWSLKDLQCGQQTGDKVECIAEITSQPTRYRTSAESAEKMYPGGNFKEVFDMTASGSAWNMTFIAQRAS